MEQRDENDKPEEQQILSFEDHIDFLVDNKRQVSSQAYRNKYNRKPPTPKGSLLSKSFVHSKQIPDHPLKFKDPNKPKSKLKSLAPSDEKQASSKSSYISHSDFRFKQILLHWK